MTQQTSIAVIGAGSWGTALAKILAERHDRVCLWAHEPEVVEGIQKNRRNPLFLADIELPAHLRVSNSLSEVLSSADLVVSVLPSHVLTRVWQQAAPFLAPQALLVNCSKGIDPKTFQLTSQLLDACLPKHDKALRAVLSGPSFAHEVAKGMPTSVVLAGESLPTLERMQKIFHRKTFLPFLSEDPIGVQVGGAVKNVIAIAAGLSAGLNFGHNTLAALVTLGLYEMMKVGHVLGAKARTFAGLSGLGDLVLTTTSEQSRNFSVGKALGRGESVEKILQGKMVAEGIETAHAVSALGKKYQINLPICDVVSEILLGKLSPQQAVNKLTAQHIGEELRSLSQEAW